MVVRSAPTSYLEPVFEEVLEEIERRPEVAAPLHAAVLGGEEIVLDYHHHGDETSWCVTIGSRPFGSGSGLTEIVHVRNVGRTREHCLPQMATLGEELRRHLGMRHRPLIYLEGRSLGDVATGGSG